MPDKVIDVVGIGNAIVDVIAHCDEAFIARMNLNKGAMTLIDTASGKAMKTVPAGRVPHTILVSK